MEHSSLRRRVQLAHMGDAALCVTVGATVDGATVVGATVVGATVVGASVGAVVSVSVGAVGDVGDLVLP